MLLLRRKGSNIKSVDNDNDDSITVPLIELGGADSIVGSIREDELILNTVPALAINSESGKFTLLFFEIIFENGQNS